MKYKLIFINLSIFSLLNLVCKQQPLNICVANVVFTLGIWNKYNYNQTL